MAYPNQIVTGKLLLWPSPKLAEALDDKLFFNIWVVTNFIMMNPRWSKWQNNTASCMTGACPLQSNLRTGGAPLLRQE